MDKGFTKEIFLQAGIDTPKGAALYRFSADRSLAALGLSLPVVVKPCSGGSSIGVYIVNTEEEYSQALEKSFCYEDEVIVEEYIRGREFACGIISGKALPPIEIIPKTGFFDYANKYQDGATEEVCPADIPKETAARMMKLTERAFHALGHQMISKRVCAHAADQLHPVSQMGEDRSFIESVAARIQADSFRPVYVLFMRFLFLSPCDAVNDRLTNTYDFC